MSHLLLGRGGGGEVLDRPANNFDIAGIPRDAWSSGLFNCFDHIPSCFMAFCCSPILWSQVDKKLTDLNVIFLQDSNKSANSCFNRFEE
jgi:hypothetical protein